MSKYMFHLAFENSIEEGYVTEKAFHALLAGTVPVYLGDSSHLLSLLPSPSSAIFVSDFRYNMTALAQYLFFLQAHEEEYEKYREWRKSFTSLSLKEYLKRNVFLSVSWPCRMCQWVVNNASKYS